MKKTFLPVLVIAAFISLTIASCTKEQTLLDLLYGTWKYESSLNSNGVLIPLGTDVISYDGVFNFYKCYDKTEEFCTGTYKATTTYTAISGLPTDISTGDFNYRVFGKTQIPPTL